MIQKGLGKIHTPGYYAVVQGRNLPARTFVLRLGKRRGLGRLQRAAKSLVSKNKDLSSLGYRRLEVLRIHEDGKSEKLKRISLEVSK